MEGEAMPFSEFCEQRESAVSIRKVETAKLIGSYRSTELNGPNPRAYGWEEHALVPKR